MKALSIVLALLLGVGFISAAVWISQHPPAQSGKNAESVYPPAKDNEPPIPKVASHGPYPKAVVPVTEHNFGAKEQYYKGSHIFVIKNEGEAPLEVVARESDTTCQCTVGKLAGDGTIPPGGETTIELKWEIKSPRPEFRHTAKIRTNDPDHTVIEMAITGKVDIPFHVLPESYWDLGETSEDLPAKGSGMIFSRMHDEFEISEVVCKSDRFKFHWEPLSQEELTEHKAKCGYKVFAEIDMKNIVGGIGENVEIKTKDQESSAARIVIKARRPGPIEILGRNWDANNSILRLGEFPAADGKTVELTVLSRLEEDLQLESAESDHQIVKAEWSRDEKFQTKTKTKRYLLKLQILPGATINRQGIDAERLHLKFDNPRVGTYSILLEYLST